MPVGAKFCPACGAPVVDVGAIRTNPVQASVPPGGTTTAQPSAGPTPPVGVTPAVVPNRAATLAMAATTLVGSVVVLGFAAVYQLSLATKGNAAGFLGFLVDAGFAVALYVSGYQGLKEGKVQ